MPFKGCSIIPPSILMEYYWCLQRYNLIVYCRVLHLIKLSIKSSTTWLEPPNLVPILLSYSYFFSSSVLRTFLTSGDFDFFFLPPYSLIDESVDGASSKGSGTSGSISSFTILLLFISSIYLYFESILELELSLWLWSCSCSWLLSSEKPWECEHELLSQCLWLVNSLCYLYA